MRALLLGLLAAAPVHAGMTQTTATSATMTWPGVILGAFRNPAWRLTGFVQSPTLTHLARLDYNKPENRTRLELLITHLELAAKVWPMTPQEFATRPLAKKALFLHKAAEAASRDAERRAKDALKEIRRGKVPDSDLRALYEKAERIALLESPYLGPALLKDLRKALLPLLSRVHAYEEALNSGRIRGIQRELDAQAPAYQPGDDSQGGLMEAPPPKDGVRWDGTVGYDGFLEYGDGKYSGYSLDSAEAKAHARRNRDQNGLYRYDLPEFKRLIPEPYDPESPDFPLDAALEAYQADLERAAEDRRSRLFWRLAAKAYARFEGFVRVHLELIESVGRIGPAAKNTLERLQSQTENIYSFYDGLSTDHSLRRRYGLFGQNNPLTRRTRIVDAISGLRSHLEERSKGLNAEAEAAYRRAEEVRGNKNPTPLVRQLLILDSYYRWRLAAAEKDPDPAHKQELLHDLKGGFYRPGPEMTIVFPSLARLIELRNRASRRGGGEHIQPWTFILGLTGVSAFGIGSMLALLLFPNQIALYFPIALISTIAFGAWISYLAVSDTVRGWRFRRMAKLLVKLSAEVYPKSP